MKEFDKVWFYSEMEKVSKNTKGIFHSLSDFIHEVIYVLQKYFSNINKKKAIVKLRKEIYWKSNTEAPVQISVVSTSKHA